MKDREQIKLNTLRQMEELVESRIEKVQTVMDDYDGGQMSAYENVLGDIRAFRSIIEHTNKS